MIEHESIMYSTLEPTHLTNFIKQLRKTTPNKLKYFACGEYGDQTGRPHYHLIVFNYPNNSPVPRREIADIWTRGSTHLGSVTYDSCRYVAGYVQKKWYGDPTLSSYFPSYPPFARMSQGLGLKFALKNEKQLLNNAGTTINGKAIGLPRYYRKKLIGDDIEKSIAYNRKIADRETDNIELHLSRLDKKYKSQQYHIDSKTSMIKGKFMPHEIAERSKQKSRRQFNENLNAKEKNKLGGTL